MNSHLYHDLLRPWGLYAPKNRQGTNEDVRCSDKVGIRCVAATDTTKLLSLAIILRHLATELTGTLPGGIGRRHRHKQNTVLLRFGLYPVEHLPVCPGCHSLSKSFAPILLISPFHVVQFLHTYGTKRGPGQLVESLIDQVVSFSQRSLAPFAPRSSAFDFVSHLFESDAEEFGLLPIGERDQFVDPNIEANDLSLRPGRLIRQLDPQDKSIFRKSTSLNKPGPAWRATY